MTTSYCRFRKSIFSNRLLAACALAVGLVAFLLLLFRPQWNTNDDISMSMIAHGYGGMKYPSPKLIYSNVIWGAIVQRLGFVPGILGYSLATYAVILTCLVTFAYVLLELGFRFVTVLATLLLIFTVPILSPQFTMNAGLLTLCALMCWAHYGLYKKPAVLAVGALLAYIGFLVRTYEFALLAMAAPPLLARRKLWDKPVLIALGTLALAVATSLYIDHSAYQSPEWAKFNSFQTVRTQLTDLGGAQRLLDQPEVLARGHFSHDDIALIASWFFEDDRLARPAALKEMLAEVGGLVDRKQVGRNAWLAIKFLMDPALIFTGLAALLLGLGQGSWSTYLTWLIGLGLLASIGAAGRPGIVRVYLPLVALFLVASLLRPKNRKSAPFLSRSSLVILAVLGCLSLWHAGSMAAADRKISEAQAQLGKISPWDDGRVLYALGGAFPYSKVYPVFHIPEKVMRLKLHAMASRTFQPGSWSNEDRIAGRGLVDLLQRPEGVELVANANATHLLGAFCEAHLHLQMQTLGSDYPFGSPAQVLRCVARP